MYATNHKGLSAISPARLTRPGLFASSGSERLPSCGGSASLQACFQGDEYTGRDISFWRGHRVKMTGSPLWRQFDLDICQPIIIINNNKKKKKVCDVHLANQQDESVPHDSTRCLSSPSWIPASGALLKA